ncbi:MAG: hypothetical protein Kow0080_37060 [Candidatus Promineifilaceae bacterium]
MSNNIVCATRGGEGSRAVQMAAIKYAKEHNLRLIFFYVTDVGSLGKVDDTLISALTEELNWMGKTLLAIAQRRADMAGLHTDVVIRVGNFREEMVRFLEENHAQRLFLGAPRGTTANVFGDDAIEHFARSIQEQTDIPVTIIRPDVVQARESVLDR